MNPAAVIVQARMGSTRFPGKSLAEIAGRPSLWYLFRQISFCRKVGHTVLATTRNPLDDPLAAFAEGEGWSVFRGDETDVLGRYCGAARAIGAMPETPVVRLTGDDIFTDPRLVDALIGIYDSLGGRIDAVYTERSDRFPYGSGVEIFSFRALERAEREAEENDEREHVSPYIIGNPDIFPAIDVSPSRDLGGFPLSIDRPEDLDQAALLIAEMDRRGEPPYSLADVLGACHASAETASAATAGN